MSESVTWTGPLSGATPLVSGATFTLTQQGTYTFNLVLAGTIAKRSNPGPTASTNGDRGLVTVTAAPPDGVDIQLTATVNSSMNSEIAGIGYRHVTPRPPGFAIKCAVTGTAKGSGTISCTVNPDGSLLLQSLPEGVTVTGLGVVPDLVSQVNEIDGELSVAITQLPSGTSVQFPGGTATFAAPQGSACTIQLNRAPGTELVLSSAPTSTTSGWPPSGITFNVPTKSQGPSIAIATSASAAQGNVSIAYTGSSSGSTGTSFDLSVVETETASPGGTTNVYITDNGCLEVWQLAPGMNVSGANPTYRVQDAATYSLIFEGGAGGVQFNEPSGGVTYEPPSNLQYATAIVDNAQTAGTTVFDINTNMGSINDPTLINEPPQM